MFGNDESDVIFDAVGSRIPDNQDLAHFPSFAQQKCLSSRLIFADHSSKTSREFLLY